MIDSEVEKFIDKPHKLWAVERTREPLRPPEQELNARPVRPGKPKCTAEFHRRFLFGSAS
jgi:hypothetical protein